MRKCEDIAGKVRDGVRLTREEGIALLRDGDLLELGALADTVRWRKHPEPVVTYIIDRNINYTNVCTAQCAFCAFYRDLPSKEGYLLSKAELSQKIEETIALGGRQILLQGGLHPDLGIEFYEELFRWMKASYPIWIHGLSPAEVQHIARVSKLPLEEALRRLMAAGLDSIPGGGAEILSDRVRRIIGIAKGSTSEWLEVMETAHRLGMRTTATMMFGHVETLEERVDHLLHLRDLQDRTGGFTAFIGWTFQPENTALAGDELTSFQYLRTLAVSRVLLDNFPSVQASWVTQGSKIGQLSLRFGANDFGSLMIEENVVSAAGAHFRLTEAEIARAIQEAGFVPKRRTMDYRIVGDPYCWSHETPGLPEGHAAATSIAELTRGIRRSGSVAQPAGRDVLVAGRLFQGFPVGLRLLQLPPCGQDPGACLLGSAPGEDEDTGAADGVVLALRRREARVRRSGELPPVALPLLPLRRLAIERRAHGVLCRHRGSRGSGVRGGGLGHAGDRRNGSGLTGERRDQPGCVGLRAQVLARVDPCRGGLRRALAGLPAGGVAEGLRRGQGRGQAEHDGDDRDSHTPLPRRRYDSGGRVA